MWCSGIIEEIRKTSDMFVFNNGNAMDEPEIIAGILARQGFLCKDCDMRRYVFALDLDGTTLNSQGKLSEYTKEVFLRAIEAGAEIIVASGRALGSLPEEVRNFPGIRYAITSNGAAVYDMKSGEAWRRWTLSPDSVDNILGLAQEAWIEKKIALETFIEGAGYADRAYVEDPARFGSPSQRAVRYIQNTRQPVGDMQVFLKEHRENLDCIDIISADSSELSILRKQIVEGVPGIMLTASVPHMLEIADMKAGKGNALVCLLDYLGISAEDTAAFGNAENDIDMMQVAGMGYAVANADPSCLEAADEIIPSNDEDGVAKMMKMWVESGDV